MQPTLFEELPSERVVNVASVPQRSPFRYPGGKTWLVPRVRRWLAALEYRPVELIEPFAGGGIVGLTTAFENLADSVTLIEIDAQVAAVWKTLIDGEAETLAARILSFSMTGDNVRAALHTPPQTYLDAAFQTILKNRVNRGGILAAGTGMLNAGENGRGILSRWYPETLSRRMLEIHAQKERLRFVEGDGLKALESSIGRKGAVFFIDPPYTAGGKKAGSRLYTHHTVDHVLLFEIVSSLAGDFLMTYDDTVEIRDLAQRHGFYTTAVPMKNTHHAQMMELLITRKLFE